MLLPWYPRTARETLFSLGSLSKWKVWERKGREGGWSGKALVGLGGGTSFGRRQSVISAGLCSMISAHSRNWGGGDCRHPAGDQAARPTEGSVLGMVGQPGDSSSQPPSHFLLPALRSSVLKLSLPLLLSLLVATVFSSVYFPTFLFSFCYLRFVI